MMEGLRSYAGISLVVILLLSLLMVGPVKSAGSGVNIIIDGPTEVFVNESQEYIIEIGGNFANDADNWTLKSSVDGEGEVKPKNQESSEDGTFSINLKVTKETKVTLSLEATATKDNSTRSSSTELEIKAVEPVTTNISVRNPTKLTLTDVELGIFIDGKLERTVPVSSIEPRSTKNMKVNWSKEGLDSGEHTIEIWVDYGYTDGDRFVKNEKIYTSNFYIEGKSTLEEYGWVIGLAVIGAGVGVFYYLRRRKKKRRPW